MNSTEYLRPARVVLAIFNRMRALKRDHSPKPCSESSLAKKRVEPLPQKSRSWIGPDGDTGPVKVSMVTNGRTHSSTWHSASTQKLFSLSSADAAEAIWQSASVRQGVPAGCLVANPVSFAGVHTLEYESPEPPSTRCVSRSASGMGGKVVLPVTATGKPVTSSNTFLSYPRSPLTQPLKARCLHRRTLGNRSTLKLIVTLIVLSLPGKG